MARKYTRKTTSEAQGRKGKSGKARKAKWAEGGSYPVIAAELKTLEDLDKRSVLYRSLKRMEAEIVEDLGGDDEVSYMARSLITRFCWLCVCIATIEHEIGRKERPMDTENITLHSRLVSNMTQIAKTIGLHRKARHFKWTGPPIDAEAFKQ